MSNKISEMTEATTIADDDLFVIVQDSSGENRRIKKSNADGYKEYYAILTQSGVNAPVATELKNTIGTINMTYDSDGYFPITSAALFTVNKTLVFIGNESSSDTYFTVLTKTDSEIGLFVSLLSNIGGGDNGLLVKTSIRIIVFP